MRWQRGLQLGACQTPAGVLCFHAASRESQTLKSCVPGTPASVSRQPAQHRQPHELAQRVERAPLRVVLKPQLPAGVLHRHLAKHIVVRLVTPVHERLQLYLLLLSQPLPHLAAQEDLVNAVARRPVSLRGKKRSRRGAASWRWYCQEQQRTSPRNGLFISNVVLPFIRKWCPPRQTAKGACAPSAGAASGVASSSVSTQRIVLAPVAARVSSSSRP